MNKTISYYHNDGFRLIEDVYNEYQKKGMNKVILSGMGSSLYAIDSIRGYLTSKGIRALAFSSFELSRFQFNHIDDKTLVIAISQSGTSMEVIELVEKAKKITTVVGIYNNEGSKLSQIADFSLPIVAGKEVSITSKTYQNTMLILNILAHRLTGDLDESFWKELHYAANWCSDWLDKWEKNGRDLYEFGKDMLLYDLLANNASLATARQLSLAYREGLHNCTSVWECADYAHGQYHSSKLGKDYLAQMFFPVFEDNTKEMKMLNYILEHDGRVMLYTHSDIKPRERLLVVKLPKLRVSLMPLVESVASETMLGMLFGPDWVKDH